MLMLRILFAWLLIAAVPMQGFAAASMLFCGMAAQHQHTAPAGEPHDHAALHDHTGGAEQAPTHHHNHANDPAADRAPDASPDAAHTCSICAACCNGVALIGLNPMAAMASAPQAALAEPLVWVHTLPSAIPDKPPRA